MLKMPDGNVRVVVEGRRRVKVSQLDPGRAVFRGHDRADRRDRRARQRHLAALLRRLKHDFEIAVNLSKNIPPEALQNAGSQEEIGALTDLVISYLEVPVEARQEMLELLDVEARARKVSSLLAAELEILEIDKELDSVVREGMNENQREYFLRERLKAIQEKLGDRDTRSKKPTNLRQRVTEAEMSDEAREKAMAEIDRMEKMPPIAPEVSVIRTYVELLSDLPWNKRTIDNLDIARAQEILDEDQLRPRKNQGSYPRIPGSAQAQPHLQRPHPLLRRPSRCRQKPAWANPSRSRSAANSFGSASAASTTKLKCAAIAAPTLLDAGPHYLGHSPRQGQQPGLHARRNR